MDPLITTGEARRQLRLTPGDLDEPDTAADVADKSAQATALIIDYIEQPEHGWIAADAPQVIKTAILLMLTLLYEEGAGATITPEIKNLLRRYRKPALA